MMFYAVLIFIICVLAYIYFKESLSYWKYRKIPFVKPLPLMGNVLDVVLLRKSLAILLGDLYLKYTDLPFFGIWVFTTPHLLVRDPDLIKHILVKDFDYFYDRNVQSNESVDEITANMMFFARNPKWKSIRNMTTPIFTSGKLKYIYPQIQLSAKNMIAFISQTGGKGFTVKDIASKYGTDIICSVAFGIDAHCFEDNETFTNIGKDIFDLSLRNTAVSATYFCRSPLVDILRIKFLKTSIGAFLTKTFIAILKERESTDVERRDMVDIMIKLRREYNLKDYELVAQATQFFLAGYETTSSTISFALHELSFNKQVQDKLRAEVNELVEDDGEFSYQTLNDTKTYLHKVILETLRKYPVVPLLGRDCASDYTIPGTNTVIEKGTPIVIPLMGLHFDPQVFPDPEKFCPERFSEDNVKERHPYCYLPFGEGQRNCIGQRIAYISTKMALSHIIKNFEVEPCEDTEVPLKLSPQAFVLYTKPFNLIFKKIAEV